MKQYEYTWRRSARMQLFEQDAFDSWKYTCDALGKDSWQLVHMEIVRTDRDVMFVGFFMREIE